MLSLETAYHLLAILLVLLFLGIYFGLLHTFARYLWVAIKTHDWVPGFFLLTVFLALVIGGILLLMMIFFDFRI